MRVLITHTDLDGLGSAILAIADGLVDQVYCWNNGFIDHAVFKGNTVTVTDLFIDQPNITIYDHHKIAVKNGISDSSRCGSRLYYEEVITNHNRNRDKFIHLIDTYDRWQDRNRDFNEALDLARLCEAITKRENALIYDHKLLNTSYKQFIEMMLQQLHNWRLTPQQIRIIDAVKAKENAVYDEAMRSVKVRVDSKGHKFAIVCMNDYVSQNANRYLREHPDTIYVIILYSTNRRKVSARAVKGFDLTTIKGLSGHPGAAGGLYSADFLDRLEDGYVKELGYKR